MTDRAFIEVRGARENNLKDILLDIPKRKLTVFTGVSGSGKSSLVFDTIAAEAQRQLNETFSFFVQGFLRAAPLGYRPGNAHHRPAGGRRAHGGSDRASP
jgi:excinuclease UvrABC ATPase subunit